MAKSVQHVKEMSKDVFTKRLYRAVGGILKQKCCGKVPGNFKIRRPITGCGLIRNTNI